MINYGLSRKNYIENFEGFSIKSMDINDRGIYFCTLVEEPDIENAPLEKQLAREGDFIYRFLNFKLEPKQIASYMEVGANYVNRALVVFSKKDNWISVDFNGWVWEMNVQKLERWPGYDIPQTDPIKPKERKGKAKKLLNAPTGFSMGRLIYIKELKVIDDEVYVCGGIRKVLKRNGYDDWKDLTLMKEHPQLHKEYLDAQKNGTDSPFIGSFKSLDGFNKNDIYACGSNGDCWHYDGVTWIRMNIPTNLELNKIVAAKDGNVYIAARDGVIVKGRDKYENNPEEWELIKSDISALNGNPFEGATWFKDKLYVSTSYGLYVLESNKLKPVEFGKEAQFSFQHVISNEEILISYGPYNALSFDGKEWKTIVSSLAR